MIQFPRCSACGRPEATREQVIAGIVAAVDVDHEGWSTIARALNDQQVPTITGKALWCPSMVQSLYCKASVPKVGKPVWRRVEGKWRRVMV